MLRAMTTDALPLDRRQRRRQETIEEVLDIAVEIMTEQGVAGLSIGEVARRMGIRPPSLYVYFPSKEAIYDALFARGAREIGQLIVTDSERLLDQVEPGQSLAQIMLEAARTFVRWTMEHPAYTQLLYWRPVPGFEPSPDAFAPAVAMVETSRHRFAELQRRGFIRADASIDDVQRDWVVILTGVVTRQIANAPHEKFDEGRFSTALGDLVTMFARHYEPSTAASPAPSTKGVQQ
jgi:AcrR family transcriptional regulator